MIFKSIIVSIIAVSILSGCCAPQKQETVKISDSNLIRIEALAAYHNLPSRRSGAYFTKQTHIYNVDAMQMQVIANEPEGNYKMTFNGFSVSFTNPSGEKYWTPAMAKLLVTNLAISGGFSIPKSLGFERDQTNIRIQGIIYNSYSKQTPLGKMTLFSRRADGRIDRMQIKDKNGEYLSSYGYNRFYQARLGRSLAHNIDIYTGDARGIDTTLIYGVEYIDF